MSDKHVLSRDGFSVTLEESEKGLKIVETKLGKRPTSRELWIAAVNCPQGNVALGRIAQVKAYEAKGCTYNGTSNGVMPSGVLSDDVDMFFVSRIFGVEPFDAILAMLKRPESIPGVTYESTPHSSRFVDDERPADALPTEGCLVIPDGPGTLAACARAGSAMQGVLLALASKRLVDLAVTRVTGETESISAPEVMRVAKTLVGKPREVLEALGILEPATRDFTSAIGSSRRSALVL